MKDLKVGQVFINYRPDDMFSSQGYFYYNQRL